MTPEELMKMLREGKEKGYITGDFPVDGVEAQRLAKTLDQQQLAAESVQNSLEEEDTVFGNLTFILMRHRGRNWNQLTHRHLEVFLGGPDWASIFYDALRCPRASNVLTVRTDEVELAETRKLKFQQAIPEYPLLGRIWDMYTDVKYEAKEIDQLRNECFRVKASTTSDRAIKSLDKLIYACDEALGSGLGLFLASD